jgi:hypothetical protein
MSSRSQTWKSKQSDIRGGYDKARRQRLIAEGRCSKCAKKLPGGYTFKTCERCRRVHADYNKTWMCRERETPDPIVLEPRPRTKGPPGCDICGLRGEHVCLQGNAEDRRPW